MTRKEKILETMLNLIAKQGIQATPMSQIAKEAGVAAGTIYHHFKSKEEIINEIYLNKKRDLGKLIENNINTDNDIKTQFFEMWKAIFYYYIENPLVFSFSQQVYNTHAITEETKKNGEKFYDKIFFLFQEGINAGHYIEMDVQLMTELIYSNISKLAELYISNSLNLSPKILNDAISFSWRAISK
ncbi:MAG: TetR/AcrR family transcriptional regulator [Bacteroidales bacterium]|nr:TetR/AcrR family transcriptional regulator [Bacteroidales bacterium]MBN2756135.1 TetR/AcrR family transcriptional regulator [Bacteroidales bacterium]